MGSHSSDEEEHLALLGSEDLKRQNHGDLRLEALWELADLTPHRRKSGNFLKGRALRTIRRNIFLEGRRGGRGSEGERWSFNLWVAAKASSVEVVQAKRTSSYPLNALRRSVA